MANQAPVQELMESLNIKQKLKVHLIKNGLTYSSEGEAFGEPTLMREIAVDTVVNEVIKFMTEADYARVQ